MLAPIHTARPARRVAGFTLIELMIVLAVVAIIAVIAIPAFTDQMRKSRRSEAVSSLQQMALLQERFRASNPAFGTAVQIGAPGSSESGYYNLAVTANSATGYTMTAAPTGAQAGDSCGTLTYRFDGTQPSGQQIIKTHSGGSRCWD
ncbi:MAG TPA: type IV pilin protein [Xanthomonadaceae bacterium]|nr:type IV pilin protein [Xanthomonadaceae bacterium]